MESSLPVRRGATIWARPPPGGTRHLRARAHQIFFYQKLFLKIPLSFTSDLKLNVI